MASKQTGPEIRDIASLLRSLPPDEAAEAGAMLDRIVSKKVKKGDRQKLLALLAKSSVIEQSSVESKQETSFWAKARSNFSDLWKGASDWIVEFELKVDVDETGIFLWVLREKASWQSARVGITWEQLRAILATYSKPRAQPPHQLARK